VRPRRAYAHGAPCSPRQEVSLTGRDAHFSPRIPLGESLKQSRRSERERSVPMGNNCALAISDTLFRCPDKLRACLDRIRVSPVSNFALSSLVTTLILPFGTFPSLGAPRFACCEFSERFWKMSAEQWEEGGGSLQLALHAWSKAALVCRSIVALLGWSAFSDFYWN